MTTTIKVQSHNYPALVQTFDRVWDEAKQAFADEPKMIEERVLKPEDGEQQFYCTTTRSLRITDLEYDDVRVAKQDA